MRGRRPDVLLAPHEATRTAERSVLASGGKTEKSFTPDPRLVCGAIAKKVVADGVSQAEGLAASFSNLVAAAHDGGPEGPYQGSGPLTAFRGASRRRVWWADVPAPRHWLLEW